LRAVGDWDIVKGTAAIERRNLIIQGWGDFGWQQRHCDRYANLYSATTLVPRRMFAHDDMK